MHPFRATSKHIGEHVAEWSIRIVASFSIIVIFLIFVFVFREATSLFITPEQAVAPAAQATDDLRPEVYNPDVMSLEERLAAEAASALEEQDVYNPDAVLEDPAAAGTDEQEVYNPDVELGMPATADATIAAPETPAAPSSLWDRLTGSVWQPVSEVPKYGMVPLLIGTAKTTIVAILLGAPLGILAALYTAFFAPRRLRSTIKPAIELLAGFPSVVIGFFCLSIVASYLQDILGTTFRLNAIVGGIGLSITVIPLVYSIAEEALSSVPRSLREASLALGSTEWQTAYRVMLPAAAPGVFAAVLLGVGRAFGETMIALMATGNAPLPSWSVLEPARTFAATIGSEMGEVVWGSEHYGILFLIGSMLFVFSFALNAITELYVKQRLIKRFQGK
jgi:phosphate transport system permease protein